MLNYDRKGLQTVISGQHITKIEHLLSVPSMGQIKDNKDITQIKTKNSFIENYLR
jgi:hypothetical protein